MGELHARRSAHCGHPSGRWPELSRAPRFRKEAATRCPQSAVNPDYIAFRPPFGREIYSVPLVGWKYGLFVMDADGTNVRTLIPPTNPVDVGEDLNDATYSADGSRIFYQRWIPGLDPAVGDERGRLRSARVLPRAGSGLGRRRPSRRPTAEWVAYWHVIQDGSGDTARLGGSSRRDRPDHPDRSGPVGQCRTSPGPRIRPRS